MAVKPIPEGYHTITPYLVIKGTPEFIEFLKKAFDAKEHFMMRNDDGTISHAELQIGDSKIMVTEATDKYGPINAMLYLYVEDTDLFYNRAVQAGAISVQEPKNMYYGDRSGGVQDKFGNQWWFGTHIEEVSPEEIKRRQDEMMKQTA